MEEDEDGKLIGGGWGCISVPVQYAPPRRAYDDTRSPCYYFYLGRVVDKGLLLTGILSTAGRGLEITLIFDTDAKHIINPSDPFSYDRECGTGGSGWHGELDLDVIMTKTKLTVPHGARRLI